MSRAIGFLPVLKCPWNLPLLAQCGCAGWAVPRAARPGVGVSGTEIWPVLCLPGTSRPIEEVSGP